jgi:hypothetical protein
MPHEEDDDVYRKGERQPKNKADPLAVGETVLMLITFGLLAAGVVAAIYFNFG